MPFFKLSDAFKELTSASGAKDTALAGAKLLGKSIFNTSKFIFEETTKHNENESARLLKVVDVTQEQRMKLEDIHKESSKVRLKGEISEIDHKISEHENFISNNDLSNQKRMEIRGDITMLNDEKKCLQRQIDNL